MGTKSREVIYGSRVRAAKMNTNRARKLAVEAAREGDRAEAHALSLRMEGFWGTGSALANHRAMSEWWLRLLEVKCSRCETLASISLFAVRRPRNAPIWKLEAALKSRSCRTPRYSPPVHMIQADRNS
jgi:hypothetical protein